MLGVSLGSRGLSDFRDCGFRCSARLGFRGAGISVVDGCIDILQLTLVAGSGKLHYLTRGLLVGRVPVNSKG